MLRAFETLVAPQHQVERINVTDYHVEGCDVCQDKPAGPGCLQENDVVQLLQRILADDLVV